MFSFTVFLTLARSVLCYESFNADEISRMANLLDKNKKVISYLLDKSVVLKESLFHLLLVANYHRNDLRHPKYGLKERGELLSMCVT